VPLSLGGAAARVHGLAQLLELSVLAGDHALHGRRFFFRVGVLLPVFHGVSLHLGANQLDEVGVLAGEQVQVLIGGLGMGFTLAETLKHTHKDAEVVVAELVPAVIQWNQSYLAELADNPLKDERVSVYEGDVGKLIRSSEDTFDAILLDVDNGPEGLTREGNAALYSPQGLKAAIAALKPKGVLGVWSAFPEPRFTKRMKQAGFKTQEVPCRAFGKKGSKHMIWLGQK